MLDAVLTSEGLIALLTLTAMEIVLGIDNVVFIAILAAKLPATQQAFARRLGLSLALVLRIGLLFTISWVMGLTLPFFSVLGHGVSGRDLILLGGGLFLIFKATWEIYDKLEANGAPARGGRCSSRSWRRSCSWISSSRWTRWSLRSAWRTISRSWSSPWCSPCW